MILTIVLCLVPDEIILIGLNLTDKVKIKLQNIKNNKIQALKNKIISKEGSWREVDNLFKDPNLIFHFKVLVFMLLLYFDLIK
jgi:hypothetical protein